MQTITDLSSAEIVAAMLCARRGPFGPPLESFELLVPEAGISIDEMDAGELVRRLAAYSDTVRNADSSPIEKAEAARVLIAKIVGTKQGRRRQRVQTSAL